MRKTKDIKNLLEETDLFTQVEAVIDRSRDALAHPDDVDVVFLTREKGRYFLNTSAQVGNNEGGAVRVLALVASEVPFPNPEEHRARSMRFPS